MELVSCVWCQEIKEHGKVVDLMGVGFDTVAVPADTPFPLNLPVSFWSYWRRSPGDPAVNDIDFHMLRVSTGEKTFLAHMTLKFNEGSNSHMVHSRNLKISISAQDTYRFSVAFSGRSLDFWDLRFLLS